MPEKKKVALVGSASSSRNQAPWGNPQFEVWYLAWRGDAKAKPDRCFDMHPLDRISNKIPSEYHDWLRKLEMPIYSIEAHPDVPNSVRYPIERVIKYLGGIDPIYWDGKYFASSIAYMLALAIVEEFEEIHLYGIDLLTDGEYAYQRPNAEYLIGLARGLGRRVYIPNTSAMVKFNHVYGYEKPPEVGFISPEILKERVKQYQEKHNKNLAEAYTADGARQEAQSLLEMYHHIERGGTVTLQQNKQEFHDREKAEAERAQAEKQAEKGNEETKDE